MCIETKARTDEDRNLGSLLQAAENGFTKAYEEAKAAGFDDEGILSEASKDRVERVYAAVKTSYGYINAIDKGGPGLLAAIEIARNLNALLEQLEAYSVITKADFDKAIAASALSNDDGFDLRTVGGYEA